MRLARFAVAGLALGIAAGFVAALLRPRPRVQPTPGSTQSLVEAVGGPIAWGSRPAVTSPKAASDAAAGIQSGPVAR